MPIALADGLNLLETERAELISMARSRALPSFKISNANTRSIGKCMR